MPLFTFSAHSAHFKHLFLSIVALAIFHTAPGPVASLSAAEVTSGTVEILGGDARAVAAATVVAGQSYTYPLKATCTRFGRPIYEPATLAATAIPSDSTINITISPNPVQTYTSTTATLTTQTTTAPQIYTIHNTGTTPTCGTLNPYDFQLTVTAPPAGDLYVVSPFLLGAPSIASIDLPALLPPLASLDTVAATGLVADNTSAAIALYKTTNNSLPVTFTATNGISLLPFSPDFMANPPGAGQNTLTISPSSSSFIKIGAMFYAAALVQTPALGATYSFSDPIVITATQNGSQKKQSLDLVPTPVVFVHGLWGNENSLQFTKNALSASEPWSKRPYLLYSLKYPPNVAFDNGLPANALKGAVRSLREIMDNNNIVGARVDILAHSMGGLVTRSRASAGDYRLAKNRWLGDFHTIVTLNTPEFGSALATYLVGKNGAGRNVYDQKLDQRRDSFSVRVWKIICSPNPTKITIGQCFDKLEFPIAGPDGKVGSGAPASLQPKGKSLNNAKLSGPDIKDAIWRIVASVEPRGSLLRYGLNALITASTPIEYVPPTIDSLLKTTNHDTIVTYVSQIGGNTDSTLPFRRYFIGLSHTSGGSFAAAVGRVVPFVTDANIKQDDGVNRLVACWLRTSGSTNCSQFSPMVGAKQVAEASIDTSKIATDALTDAQFNAMITEELKKEVKIKVVAPREAELGSTFHVTMEVPSGAKPIDKVTLWQKNEKGEHIEELQTLKINYINSKRIYVAVKPLVHGDVTLSFGEHIRGGGGDGQNIKINIKLPSRSPDSIKGNEDSEQIALYMTDLDNEFKVNPVVYYKNIYKTDQYGKMTLLPIKVDGKFDVRVVSSGSNPSIRVVDGDKIEPVHPGRETVEVRVGTLVDRFQVVVRENEDDTRRW